MDEVIKFKEPDRFLSKVSLCYLITAYIIRHDWLNRKNPRMSVLNLLSNNEKGIDKILIPVKDLISCFSDEFDFGVKSLLQIMDHECSIPIDPTIFNFSFIPPKSWNRTDELFENLDPEIEKQVREIAKKGYSMARYKQHLEEKRESLIKQYPDKYNEINELFSNRERLSLIESILQKGSKREFQPSTDTKDYKLSFTHDPDYNNITLNGIQYILKSHYQREAIKYMHEHSVNLTDLFGQHTILEAIGHDSKYKRLKDIFKGKTGTCVWEEVIFKSKKGSFRINY